MTYQPKPGARPTHTQRGSTDSTLAAHGNQIITWHMLSAVNTHHLRVWPIIIIIIIISHPRASAPPLAEDERGGLPSRLLPRLLGVEQLGAAARRQVAGHAFIPLVVAAAV